MATTVLIMIDGLAADDLNDRPHDLPTLTALGERGMHVTRLQSDLPATSLPGRTGIVTGVPPSTHGIFGNSILDGEAFRYANPDDVRVPTLAQRAKEAGLDVASVGYGMVRPEDTTTFVPPWWVGEMIMRGRDAAPVKADRGWTRLLEGRPDARLAALRDAGVEVDMPDAYQGGKLGYLTAGTEGDRRAMRSAAALAASDTPPDLILTEVLMPDVVQHVAGCGTPAAIGSLGTADAWVAVFLAELERAGRLDDVNVMVVSDHGHGPVERALHPERILPGVTHASEGGTLFLYLPTGGLDEATERLAAHDVRPLDGDVIPADRPHVHAFAAPPGTAFEPAADDAPSQVTWGQPRYVSSHGFRAGSPRDDRACVLAGPDIPAGKQTEAPASAVEATLAALLGLPAGGHGPSLISD